MGATGQDLRLGIKKGSVWGTAVACGAGDGYLFLPGGPKFSRPDQLDESLGLGWPSTSDAGEIKVEGSRKAYLRYKGFDLLWYLLMGSGAHTFLNTPTTGTATGGSTTTLVNSGLSMTPDAQIGKYLQWTKGGVTYTKKITDNDATTFTFGAVAAAGAPANLQEYSVSTGVGQHVYTLADNTDGLFATLALLVGAINTSEIPSAKFSGFQLTGETGKALEMTMDIIGNTMVWDSATNTVVTMASLTCLEQGNRVKRSHGVFRMNAQSGDALDSGDVVAPSKFGFTFKPPYAGVYGLAASADQIDEPTRNGNPQISLDLEFPRYSSATPFTDWGAKNAKKLDITFTGGLITGTTYRSIFIEIPHLEYSEVDAPEAAGIIANPCKFNVMNAAAAPTGMTALTKPFRITIVNDYCGDPAME